MTIIADYKASCAEKHTPLNCNECPYRRTVTSQPIRLGRLTLYNEGAMWDGQPVGLTKGEYRILHAMATSNGVWVSYRQIFDTLHYKGFHAGQGPNGWHNNVRCMIKRIRQKFAKLEPNFNAIENLVGVGYRFIVN